MKYRFEIIKCFILLIITYVYIITFNGFNTDDLIFIFNKEIDIQSLAYFKITLFYIFYLFLYCDLIYYIYTINNGILEIFKYHVKGTKAFYKFSISFLHKKIFISIVFLTIIISLINIIYNLNIRMLDIGLYIISELVTITAIINLIFIIKSNESILNLLLIILIIVIQPIKVYINIKQPNLVIIALLLMNIILIYRGRKKN